MQGKNGFGLGKQEWSYVTVQPSAHMFWWLYYVNPPDKPDNFDPFTKPLLIWLQGGPGQSSTGYGNFGEIGPFNTQLQPRNNTLTNDYNILFIDSPVGSGFSYVDLKSKYSIHEDEIVKNLMLCIRSFLNKIPGFSNVPTYVIGEGYDGRIAAALTLGWFEASIFQISVKQITIKYVC